MKTTVVLSDTLRMELKAIAAREHRGLSDVIEEVVALGCDLGLRRRPSEKQRMRTPG